MNFICILNESVLFQLISFMHVCNSLVSVLSLFFPYSISMEPFIYHK